MSLTREQVMEALVQGSEELLDEIMAADRFPAEVRAIGCAHLRAVLRGTVERFCVGTSVDRLIAAGLTAQEIKEVLKDVVRSDVMQALAPLRPS